MKRFIGFALLFISVLVLSCKERATQAIKTEKINFVKEGDLQIFRKDSLLVDMAIEIAETDYEVQTGLMYRQSMGEKEAMLFIFPDVAVHSFYMKNTEFALDILFIDENQKVASFQKNAQPLNEASLPSQVPIKYVLEINAGLSDKWNLMEGDSVAFSRLQ